MKLKDFYVNYNKYLNRFFLIHNKKLFLVFKLIDDKVEVSPQNEKELAKLYATPEGRAYFDHLTRKIKEFYAKQAKIDTLRKTIESLFYIGKNGALKG